MKSQKSGFKSADSSETDHNGCISKLELIAAVQRDATVVSSVCDHSSVMLAILFFLMCFGCTRAAKQC